MWQFLIIFWSNFWLLKNSQKALDFWQLFIFLFGKYSQQKNNNYTANVLIIIGLCTCFPRVWVDFGGGSTRASDISSQY
jgi:hypothetical protein